MEMNKVEYKTENKRKTKLMDWIEDLEESEKDWRQGGTGIPSFWGNWSLHLFWTANLLWGFREGNFFLVLSPQLICIVYGSDRNVVSLDTAMVKH